MSLTPYVPDKVTEGYFSDVTAPGAGETGKVLVWNNATGVLDWVNSLSSYTLVTPTIASFANAAHTHQDAAGGGQLDHGLALTGLTDDDHTQYLLATGTRTGASIQAQTFTNGVTTGAIYSLSTTMLVQPTGTTCFVDFKPTNPNGSASLKLFRKTGAGGDVNVGQWGAQGGNDSGMIFQTTDADNAPHATFLATPPGSLYFTTGNTKRIIVKSTGYTGIGEETPTAFLDVKASTTAAASLRIRSGVAPTSPNNGDVWFDGTNFKRRIGGVTKTFTVT